MISSGRVPYWPTAFSRPIICIGCGLAALISFPILLFSKPPLAPSEMDAIADQQTAKASNLIDIDALLGRQLYWMLRDNKRTEFIALADFLRSTRSKNDFYINVLFQAAAHPDPLYLLVLIKAGLVDVNAYNKEGFSVGSCVFDMTYKDGTEQIERLRLLKQCGYKPRFPELLVEAAINDSTSIILALEEFEGQELKVNVTYSGTTPLIEAMKSGASEFIGMLVSRDADISVRDKHGKTALDYLNDPSWLSQKNPKISDDAINLKRVMIRKLISKEK
jgi:hypothetical protein